MKRLIACVSLVAAATTAAAVLVPATPADAAHHGKMVARAKCRVAPADEYFGKLKMSILGIRNTIKDQGLKVDYQPEKASSTFNAIALTEDAIHDWEHKYPCDSWLPGTIYALEHYYTKIHTEDGVRHVHATYAWLHRDFPRARMMQVAMRENSTASAMPSAGAAVVTTGGVPAASPNP